MIIDKKQLTEAIEKWESLFEHYSLPAWDSLPEVDLYMDQVISILNKKLEPMSLSSEKITVTPTMVNNYVKLKIIPAPVKKKYSRIHLAYLLVVCTLKQTLSISTIQKIFPLDLTEEEVFATYSSFVKNQLKASGYVREQIMEVANPIINADDSDDPYHPENFLMQLSISANIFKALTEKITDFEKI